jgi:hypothetical protein
VIAKALDEPAGSQHCAHGSAAQRGDQFAAGAVAASSLRSMSRTSAIGALSPTR